MIQDLIVTRAKALSVDLDRVRKLVSAKDAGQLGDLELVHVAAGLDQATAKLGRLIDRLANSRSFALPNDEEDGSPPARRPG
jgi:hypothetical protein